MVDGTRKNSIVKNIVIKTILIMACLIVSFFGYQMHRIFNAEDTRAGIDEWYGLKKEPGKHTFHSPLTFNNVTEFAWDTDGDAIMDQYKISIHPNEPIQVEQISFDIDKDGIPDLSEITVGEEELVKFVQYDDNNDAVVDRHSIAIKANNSSIKYEYHDFNLDSEIDLSCSYENEAIIKACIFQGEEIIEIVNDNGSIEFAPKECLIKYYTNSNSKSSFRFDGVHWLEFEQTQQN